MSIMSFFSGMLMRAIAGIFIILCLAGMVAGFITANFILAGVAALVLFFAVGFWKYGETLV